MVVKEIMKRHKRNILIAVSALLLSLMFSFPALTFFANAISPPPKAVNVSAAPIDAEAGSETYRLPIVMYHSIHKNQSGKYNIPPQQLEKDLVYIKEKGYTAVLVSDLVNFQEKGKPLPEKPIMLTFDDGSLSVYLHAFPLLKKHNMKFVIAAVGSFTNANYDKDGNIRSDMRSSMNWEQLKEIYDSGLAEIQNHSYNMHSFNKGRNGMKRNKDENLEDYKAVISRDLGKMKGLIREKTGFECTAVAYPFGAFTYCLPEIIKDEGYKAALICYEKINIISRDSDLFNLCRYNRPGGISTESFFESKMKL